MRFVENKMSDLSRFTYIVMSRFTEIAPIFRRHSSVPNSLLLMEINLTSYTKCISLKEINRRFVKHPFTDRLLIREINLGASFEKCRENIEHFLNNF